MVHLVALHLKLKMTCCYNRFKITSLHYILEVISHVLLEKTFKNKGGQNYIFYYEKYYNTYY